MYIKLVDDSEEEVSFSYPAVLSKSFDISRIDPICDQDQQSNLCQFDLTGLDFATQTNRVVRVACPLESGGTIIWESDYN